MHVQQKSWSKREGWRGEDGGAWRANPQVSLVLVFGARECFADPGPIDEARIAFPRAHVVGCSTSGEILGEQVAEGGLTFTAIEFERAWPHVVTAELSSAEESCEAGKRLARELGARPGLVHVLALSDGLHVNGSELVRGIITELPGDVHVTGGLAGDGTAFQQTLIYLDGESRGRRVAAIGLYGEGLKVGFGSGFGCDPFGPERRVTRSKGNVLYELDGECALTLYERYLGEHAAGLPASALNFPLSVRRSPTEPGTVRTILAVNREERSMTFAGDVPTGMYARLMRANVNHLVDGAARAAARANEGLGGRPAELALLVSCVARRLVMRQQTEEEVESVRDVLGTGAALAGFYSYGEICPAGPGDQGALHNQTMTVTAFSEAA